MAYKNFPGEYPGNSPVYVTDITIKNVYDILYRQHLCTVNTKVNKFFISENKFSRKWFIITYLNSYKISTLILIYSFYAFDVTSRSRK
jgi:hypothetical protein